MTALTQDNVRRLDALNLIEAIANEDGDKAASIMALYREMDRAENPDHAEACASHGLAWCLAFTAAALLNGCGDQAEEFVNRFRGYSLGDEVQP
jgi:hypothetical protein